MWRGITYNNGLVLQPEAVVNYKSLSFSVWSNITVWDVDAVKSNEIDFCLSISQSLLNFDIESSLNYYNYIKQEGSPNTAEFFLGIGYPAGNFNFFARGYVDIIAYSGAVYGEVGAEYEKELSEHFSFSATLLASIASKKFNENYLEFSTGAFNIATGDLTITYSPFKNFSIEPYFQYNMTINEDLRELLNTHSGFIGINFRKEF